jgi:hypothetical protein
MMKSKFTAAVLCFAVCAGLWSCSKDDKSPIQDLDAMFAQLKTASNTYSVTAGTHDTITGAKGTLVIFNPTSFVDASGNPITSGTVRIELTEVYKPGEMILNRINTVTDQNNLLTSGGQVHIKATQGSAQVRTVGYGLGFRQSGSSESAMAIFYGGPRSQFEPSSNDNTIIWGNDTFLNIKGTSRTSNEYFYLFDSVTNFGWINCDFFIDDPRPRTNIDITVPAEYDHMNTQVFIVLPEYNSVLSPRSYNAATQTFGLGSDASYHIPVGLSTKIVALATVGDNYYIDIVEATATSGMSLSLAPKIKSESELIALLSGL